MPDRPLHFHASLDTLLDSFRNVIASLTWLKASAADAENFFRQSPFIIELTCSTSEQVIKVDKSILKLIRQEGINQPTPLFSQTLINFYRVFTIAVKDVVWEEAAFEQFLQSDQVQFLRHLRNASAHNNSFYWGRGAARMDTISCLPISWRDKKIEEALEGTPVYMNFMKPGDIFFLLSDISGLVSGTSDLQASN